MPWVPELNEGFVRRTLNAPPGGKHLSGDGGGVLRLKLKRARTSGGLSDGTLVDVVVA